MSFFANKNIFQKIIIAILIVTLFSFVFCNKVRADDGILIKPVMSLLNALGDGVMNIVHRVLLDQSESDIRINLEENEGFNLLSCIMWIGLSVVIAAAVIFTAGAFAAAAPFLVGAIKGITVLVVGAVSIGLIHHTAVSMGKNIVLPIFNVTPEDIFSGEMAIFDVDFFNPNTEREQKKVIPSSDFKQVGTTKAQLISALKEVGIEMTEEELKFSNEDVTTPGNRAYLNVGKGYRVMHETGGTVIGYAYGTSPVSEKYYIAEPVKSSTEETYLSIAYQIRPTISMWYNTLRNIALVGSLTVLVYIGIRIITSSSSGDKAKYKQRIVDWLVSICLIFVMHYIMAGSNIVVGKISNLLNSIEDPMHMSTITFDENKHIEKVKKAIQENEESLINAGIATGGDLNRGAVSMDEYFPTTDGFDGKTLVWPTNLMGMVRIQAQAMYEESTFVYVGYTIMYLMLVAFTVIFTFTYFRRILYMAFLTIIAPLVAMTYSLDKLKDGKAQGFNMWFREYIVNLIIQPIHLLLYTVLVTTALELAIKNPLYGIVAIGFMIPAEKLVRKFFGVPATETQGFLSGPAGTALAMTGLNKLLGHRPPKRPEKDEKQEDKDAIKFRKESLNPDDLFGKGSTEQTSEPSGALGAIDTAATSGNTEETKTSSVKETSKTAGEKETTENTGEARGADETDTQKTLEDNKKQERLERYKKDPNYEKLKAGMHQARQGIEEKNQSKWIRETSYKQSKPNSKLGGIKNVFGSGVRGLGRKITSPKTGKMLYKGALGLGARGLGLAVSVGAGALGLAFGAASGDPTKAWQYAAGAGLAGYKSGTAVGKFSNQSLDNIGTSAANVGANAREAYEEGYYQEVDEYYKAIRQREAKKRAKEILRDDEWIRKYARISKKSIPEARKYLEERPELLAQGIGYGFDQANEFAALEEAQKQTGGDTDRAFKLLKFAKLQSSKLDDAMFSEKTKTDLKNSYIERFRNSPENQGLSDKQLDAKAETMYNQLQAVNDIYTKK